MSASRQLPHTWALLERSVKPTLEQLTSALLRDWASNPATVDLDLILAQLRASTTAGQPTRGPDLSPQLGHLVWWEHAKLASTHLGLQAGKRATALGTVFELGLLLISTTREHPQLQEASLMDMHEAWARDEAGDDPSRAANLREQLVLLVVVEGKGSLAPDLFVIARREVGERGEEPAPIGVLTARLHGALERVRKEGLSREVALASELERIGGLIARHGDPRWRECIEAYDRKTNIDRFRTGLRRALENLMTLLERTTGVQAKHARALAELREAASILLFRVFFVVALERRGLLYEKPLRPGQGLRGLIAAGDAAGDSPFSFLQDLTAHIRESKSATGRRKKSIGVAIKHASIFRNRPTRDFSDGLQAWLDGLDAATPGLIKDATRLREWDDPLAELEPLALGQLRRYESESYDLDTPHIQRLLGDVYEQILAMIPVRVGSGKTSRIQLTVDGKARGETSAKALQKSVNSERKVLGAHYTPADLVREVVLAALEPAFTAAWARAGRKVSRYRAELLGLRVLDPAMGSGHFLNVAAQEIARELAWSQYFGRPREPDQFEVWPTAWTADYEHCPDPWMRVEATDRESLDRIAASELQGVVQSCCYGVDVNPLAVELGKLSMWLATMVERQARNAAPESPPPRLTFVDKNLRCGDSLRGVDEQTVIAFFRDVYGVAEPNQGELFGLRAGSLDDALRCMLRLHAVLSKSDAEVVDKASALLHGAGKQLGRHIAQVSADPQDLRAQLHEVTRELSHTLRWTWDLAFLYEWYGRREDALWDALTDEGTTAETWVGLLGGPGSVSKKHELYRARVRALAAELRAFHWQLEFYDVFHREASGFDVIVANPPFLGSQDLRSRLGEAGIRHLRASSHCPGVVDLSGFFLLAFARLASHRASLGSIAPNSLAQTKNRRLVLVPLVAGENPTFRITRACATRPWPGDAAVHILVIHMVANDGARASPRRILPCDGERNASRATSTPYDHISSYLDDGPETDMMNIRSEIVAYVGMFPRGDFDRDPSFLNEVPRNEHPAVFAYLNNRDVQQQPSPVAQRIIIDVSGVLQTHSLLVKPPPEQEAWLAKHLPTLYREIYKTVRRARTNLPDTARNKHSRQHWWLFEELRPGLRAAWKSLDRVIALGAVGKSLLPTLIDRVDEALGLEIVPTHQIFVVPSDSHAILGILTSLVFETLTRRLCSTMKSDLRFTPSEVFPYFPFPWQEPKGPLAVPDATEARLSPIVDNLLTLRRDILLYPDRHDLTRAEVGGPTDLYNLFDDPECERPAIQQLRAAHHALEHAVLREYGWHDLHGPWMFDRPWLDGTWRHVPPPATRRAYLERLAALNHERAKGPTP